MSIEPCTRTRKSECGSLSSMIAGFAYSALPSQYVAVVRSLSFRSSSASEPGFGLCRGANAIAPTVNSARPDSISSGRAEFCMFACSRKGFSQCQSVLSYRLNHTCQLADKHTIFSIVPAKRQLGARTLLKLALALVSCYQDAKRHKR